jgi:HAD superfamily hydrolase (TIGR01450 family)
LDELRASGHQIRILSNAASYDHQGATAKFQMLGMQVLADEIVTSRDAALANLNDVLWGCIATPTDDLNDIPAEVLRLDTDRADFDRVEGFLFLSTQTWQEPQQNLLRESLVSNPRPVMIANADLAAPRDFGFSLEPGYFGHLMADDGLPDIRFFGKPFPEVFEIVEASLQGISPERIAMCGDTLHTDILGAAARGWRTVLVTHDGMFAGHDAQAYCNSSLITPDWTTKRI